MMHRRVVHILIPMLVLAAGALQAQDITLSAGIDSTRYRIGDWVNVHVSAHLPPEVVPGTPLAGDSAGVFEILDVRELKPSGSNGLAGRSWIVRMTTFTAGEQSIPPLEFRFLTAAGDTILRKTQPIGVTVTTVALDEKAELKDIKPPMAPTWAMEDVLPYLILLVIVGALAGGYLYYVRHKKKRLEPPVPPLPAIPPHELALSALRTLEDKRLWQQGMIKEYYSEITEIVRRFFEGRFGIIALELTSDEILQQLKGSPTALPLWKDITSFFLTADLVKFAKYQPTMAEHEAELQIGYKIVRAMIPRPQPVKEEAHAPAG